MSDMIEENDDVMVDDRVIDFDRAPASPELKELNKVLKPLIHQLLPGMIAADIMGVQPMTEQTGEIFTMKYSYKPWETFEVSEVSEVSEEELAPHALDIEAELAEVLSAEIDKEIIAELIRISGEQAPSAEITSPVEIVEPTLKPLPTKRIFYVDVGNMSKVVEAHLTKIKENFSASREET